MKSIGLSDEVYIQLLTTKHKFEQKEGRVISYDEVVKRLIISNDGKANCQACEGGEETKTGGNNNADMARKTAPKPDTAGLVSPQGEPHPSVTERA